MSDRIVATRISQENYTKLLGKCQALGGCSTYEYLRMLVETDMMEGKDVEPVRQGIKVTRE